MMLFVGATMEGLKKIKLLVKTPKLSAKVQKFSLFSFYSLCLSFCDHL